jgi:rhodanese-related sulfurtransferase
MLPSAVPSVGPTQVEPGTVLLDVREEDEWEAAHVEGALHIPLGQLPERLADLPPDTGVVVVCRSGARSGRATVWLNRNGYQAVNLEGGMQAWARSRLPMVSDSGADPVVI